MRVLLLGASGLLGRAVLRCLRDEDAQTLAIFHRTPLDGDALAGSQACRGDLLDLAWFAGRIAEFRPDVVVNCAVHICTSQDAVERTLAFDVNVRLNAFLGLLAEEHAIPLIVNASSISVYSAGDAPLRESTAPQPLDFYGLTKYLGEEALLRRPSIHVVNLRFCGLFGLHRRSGAVYNFTKAACASGEVVVPDAPSAFQFLAVADAANAVRSALRAPRAISKTYNIAAEEAVSLARLAELIAEAVPRPVSLRLDPQPVRQMPLLDISLAREELRWQPTPLRTSLRAFIEEGLRQGSFGDRAAAPPPP